jgi:hypothetical protein
VLPGRLTAASARLPHRGMSAYGDLGVPGPW